MEVNAKLDRPPATNLVNFMPLREGISKMAVQKGKEVDLGISLVSSGSEGRRLKGDALAYGSAIDLGTSSTGMCSLEDGTGTSNFLKPS